ncbi:MAG TPA: hypothetical protein P5191_08725 [Ruminococcus sp.]|mgnify:CR=1 FL=1|nr:hypothetical protein [Ruminococcus sp.]
MKRFAALFLAVLTLAGCSSKKSSDTEPPVENDDKAVEEEIKTYSKDDFKKVDLALQNAQKDIGIHLNELDLSTLDFGEKLSPCKTVADPYSYKCEWSEYENYDQLFEESLKTPAKGRAVDAVQCGNDIYLYVSYDPYCDNIHSFALFRYSMETGELKELRSFESADDSFSIGNYQIADGRLFRADFDKNCVMEMDTETGEESIFYTGNEKLGYIFTSDHDLTVMEYSEDTAIGKIIDITTGKEKDISAVDANGMFVDPDGKWWTEITPGTEKELDIVTDNFRISTGLRTFSGVFLRDNKLSILVNIGNTGYYENRMYTYDPDRMEVYVTDVSTLGTPVEYGDDILFFKNDMVYSSWDASSGTFGVSCFIPEIGTAFEIENIEDTSGIIEPVRLTYGIPMYCVRSYDNEILKLMWLPEPETADEGK